MQPVKLLLDTHTLLWMKIKSIVSILAVIFTAGIFFSCSMFNSDGKGTLVISLPGGAASRSAAGVLSDDFINSLTYYIECTGPGKTESQPASPGEKIAFTLATGTWSVTVTVFENRGTDEEPDVIEIASETKKVNVEAGKTKPVHFQFTVDAYSRYPVVVFSETEIGVEVETFRDLAEALDSIEAHGNYTVRVNRDQELEYYVLGFREPTNITIVGYGDEITIKQKENIDFPIDQVMITISNNASIKLENIILTSNAIDVEVPRNSGNLTLTGKTAIGSLRLNAFDASYSSVGIEAGWTGNIDKLHLGSDFEQGMEAVIRHWVDKQMLTGAGVTAANISRVALGNFIATTANGTITQVISDTHQISTVLVDIGKLIIISAIGDGTEQNPFQIWNETQLRGVGRGDANPDGFRNWTLGTAGNPIYYELMTDIMLMQGNWTPIGNQNARFFGIFDGGGKTITGLAIPSGSTIGMFGATGDGSVVKNLRLEKIGINGSDWLGSITGVNAGRIINCFASGNVTGSSFAVGGLVGEQNPSGSVENCYSAVNVTSSHNVGGIVGTKSSGTVINCFSTGIISSTITNPNVNDGVGGIIGTNGTNPLSNCIALNLIITTATTLNIGRLTGRNAGSLSNNYAWNGIDIRSNMNNGVGVPKNITTATGTTTGIDGEGLSAAEIRAQKAWDDANFQFGTTETSPWIWQEGKMPRLYFEEEALDWPVWLVEQGNGASEETPFLIFDETQLRRVGRETVAGRWTLAANYKLMTDITLTQGAWTPIGGTFAGTFDGNWKTITGLTTTSGNNRGMFNTVGGTVKNLRLIVAIIGTSTTGGIASRNDGTIKNCYVSGTINGSDSVGGIAGANSGTIRNCFASGNVTGGASNVGGIVGSNLARATVVNCRSDATITRTNTNNNVGGIVGSNRGDTLEKLFFNGSINANGTAIGGISGTYEDKEIFDCVALNERINTTSTTVGRLFYATTPFDLNNYALEDMDINGNQVPHANTGFTTMHGESVSLAATQVQSWWEEKPNFVFGTNEDAPWRWCEKDKHPKLWFE